MTRDKKHIVEMLERRKKDFAIEIETDRYHLENGEFGLSVTHNGYQWQTVRLLPGEARKVIEVLNKHLETNG